MQLFICGTVSSTQINPTRICQGNTSTLTSYTNGKSVRPVVFLESTARFSIVTTGEWQLVQE